MEKKQLEHLKQHHKFEAWCGSNTLKENLFIWNYFLNGRELPGWQIHSNQPVTVPGWPRFIQSIWRHPEGNVEKVLCMDVYECASRVKAHEFLLQLLGEFRLPGVERQEEIAVGDVAFAGPGDAGILFARANLVLLITNTGRELVSASDLARPFDQELYSKPEITTKAEAVPEIWIFKNTESEVQVGESVPLRLNAINLSTLETSTSLKKETSSDQERPVCYKFFSTFGEVLLEEGSPVYKPESAGQQEVTVFAINANRGVSSKTCRFNVK